MKLLYIAAPYRANTTIKIQHNIYQASLMAQYYWLKGFAVICPHLNTTNFDGLTQDHVFLKGAMTMLSKCSDIALHPNWLASTGCGDEYEYANKNKLIIHYTNMQKVRQLLREEGLI